MRRLVPLMIVTASLSVAACGRRDNPDPNPNPSVNPNPDPGRPSREDPGRVARRDSLVLGPGDVLITNRDTSVDLALVGQRIVVRLSDKTMDKVRRETDTSAVRDSGFGGSIERFVKKTVQSTLGQEFDYSLSEVRDARYENGTIILDVNGKEPRLLANTKVGGQKLMESFRPEDAQRFVAAVNARKGH
jgi:hypothetical protein